MQTRIILAAAMLATACSSAPTESLPEQATQASTDPNPPWQWAEISPGAHVWLYYPINDGSFNTDPYHAGQVFILPTVPAALTTPFLSDKFVSYYSAVLYFTHLNNNIYQHFLSAMCLAGEVVDQQHGHVGSSATGWVCGAWHQTVHAGTVVPSTTDATVVAEQHTAFFTAAAGDRVTMTVDETAHSGGSSGFRMKVVDATNGQQSELDDVAAWDPAGNQATGHLIIDSGQENSATSQCAILPPQALTGLQQPQTVNNAFWPFVTTTVPYSSLTLDAFTENWTGNGGPFCSSCNIKHRSVPIASAYEVDF